MRVPTAIARLFLNIFACCALLARFPPAFARARTRPRRFSNRLHKTDRVERAADRLAAPDQGEGDRVGLALEKIGETRRAVEERLDPDEFIVAPREMGRARTSGASAILEACAPSPPCGEGGVAKQRRLSSHPLRATLTHETGVVGHTGG